MPDTTGPRGTPCRSSILVTGAAGNLGREVVDRLQAHGALVRCLVRDQTGPRPGVEWAVGDLTDAAAVRAALVGIDAVFLIWPLLDSARAHDLVTELVAAAPRVVYLSSTAIDDEAARQSDPAAPTGRCRPAGWWAATAPAARYDRPPTSTSPARTPH
ncbi:NAD(P)H-binding protein [Streptomyces caniferus]|uniref:NAD(P)H-binding protein n=1 Tax=Streptomyces caniferus TaxID=285557 RepID=A0ABZ1VFN9_9ACTN|nr:NAD(P)H-binding protein [Streptomyces caniferus]